MSIKRHIVDMAVGMASAGRTGLSTSQGLELTLAASPPTLGMSIVRSDPVDRAQPIPTTGWVDVERAPVMRLLYRD